MVKRFSENRELSQTELKQFIAANNEESAKFQELMGRLHERELRMTETPASYVLAIVVAGGFGGAYLLLNVLNQRDTATIDHIARLAPRELAAEVVRRKLDIDSQRAPRVIEEGTAGRIGGR